MVKSLPTAKLPRRPPKIISKADRPIPKSPVPSVNPCRLILPEPCGIPAPCGLPCHLYLGPERHAVLELGNLARLAVMALPGRRGSFRQEADELFAQVSCILKNQPVPLTATTMMVFLRDAANESLGKKIARAWFGSAMPVTTFVVQPPCGGAALGVELWAAGGAGVTVKRFGPDLLSVESEGIRWVYCGGIGSAKRAEAGPYAEAMSDFRLMERRLVRAGVGFDRVVRTWLYVNQITVGDDGRQRYQELNRARTDFFRGLRLCAKNRAEWAPETIYPASTGIGTGGTHITMSCMALDSKRPDVFLMPLENPQQTSACDYQPKYSPQSPKFSRGMAVVQGTFVVTLVSGTASIVNSKSVHPGNIIRQTEQTIENIERLIAPENFARHGLTGSGATLRDIAKLRVYVKNPKDYEKCRKVCERRLPRVPAIYLHADVCRPDLLVEIEAVAFTPWRTDGSKRRANEPIMKRTK